MADEQDLEFELHALEIDLLGLDLHFEDFHEVDLVFIFPSDFSLEILIGLGQLLEEPVPLSLAQNFLDVGHSNELLNRKAPLQFDFLASGVEQL